MQMRADFKSYVKPSLYKEFEKLCEANSKDFYSSGCITTAHIVMSDLMGHTFEGAFREKKVTPKEAWENGMEQCAGHSGMSAVMTATIIAKYSPRGDEFKNWCIKDNVVMVDWRPAKKKTRVRK